MRYALLSMLSCMLSFQAVADSPSDYALQLPINVPQNASLLRLVLDADVYRAVRRPDLGDIRVFNAAGEALPMARLVRERSERLFSAQVALTPLPVAVAEGGNGAAKLSINQRGGETRVEVDVGRGVSAAPAPTRFLADTESFGRAVHAISIPLAADSLFEGRLRVETSRNLADWRDLAASEPVLAVGKGEARIERTRVELAGRAERYLRLSWLGDAPVPAVSVLDLVHREQPGPVKRHWLDLVGTAAGEHVNYVAPGLFPVDQFRLLPVEGNDVVAARVFSRAGVSARWQLQAQSVGYRLQGEASVREGPPVTIPLTRDPLWRVSPERPETAGAASRLQLGWVPEEIAFVARGAGPYLLAVGHPDKTPAWLPPATVVPGYGSGAEENLSDAHIAVSGTVVEPVARPTSVWQPGQHWWLWAALGLGVAVLGWMARGVWRDLHRE